MLIAIRSIQLFIYIGIYNDIPLFFGFYKGYSRRVVFLHLFFSCLLILPVGIIFSLLGGTLPYNPVLLKYVSLLNLIMYAGIAFVSIFSQPKGRSVRVSKSEKEQDTLSLYEHFNLYVGGFFPLFVPGLLGPVALAFLTLCYTENGLLFTTGVLAVNVVMNMVFTYVFSRCNVKYEKILMALLVSFSLVLG